MKDFSELLEETATAKAEHFQQHLDAQPDQAPPSNVTFIKNKIVEYVSPFLMVLVTGPFNTASILLQVTDKSIGIDSVARKTELLGRAAGHKAQLVQLGIYGDNKMHQAARFRGYSDCLKQMGQEGLRGMYKGNFVGVIFGILNTKLRTELYAKSILITKTNETWGSNLFTILSCTVADLITMPLLFCQSRLVIQKSYSNFRTYKHPFSILAQAPAKTWLSGSSLLIFKNALFTLSWLSFFKHSPLYSFIFSTLLSHLVLYPFMTVIRQLQCNAPGTPMMLQRKQTARECISRIRQRQGVRGFYRGFGGYALVHLFLGFIMIENNLRSGYFQTALS